MHQAVSDYVDWLRRNRRTARTAETALKAYVTQYFGDRLLGSLRPAEFEKWIAWALTYKPDWITTAVDGERVSGIYRRSVTLVSGRFVVLDDGLGFTLVAWRPVIEPRRGRPLSALVRGDHVSWKIGRQRGLSRRPGS